jgi:hypothetical protein
MCCGTLIARKATMATTQLACTVRYEVCRRQVGQRAGKKPLRMNWVVVTDESGNRQLPMQWYADRDS